MKGIGAKIVNDKLYSEFLQEIEETIELTSGNTQLEILWREVVQKFSALQDLETKSKNRKNATEPKQQNLSNQQKQLLKSLLWGTLTFSILLISFLWLVYLVPKSTIQADCVSITPSLLANLRFDTYLANGDEGEIQVTFENSINATQAITETILLNFEGPGNVRVSNSSSNLMKITSLEPGEQETRVVKFSFNEPVRLISDPSRYIQFSLVSQGNGQKCTPEIFSIATTPIYGLQKLIIFLWGSIGLATISLFWERIKKLLGSSKDS